MTKNGLAALAACLLPVLGAADMAAPSLDLGLTLTLQQQPSTSRWFNPTIFSARPVQRGVSLSVAQYLSGWEGRSLSMTEGLLSFSPDTNWTLWYSKQDYLAKGRSGRTRFDMNSDTFGARALVKQPDAEGNGGIAAQVEVIRPSSGTSRAGNSMAVFRGTRNVAGSVMYSDSRGDYQFAYTNVRGAGTGTSDVFDLGYGREFNLQEKLRGRLQADGVFQHSKIGASTRNEFKLALFGALSYDLAQMVRLEGDLTVMPFGVPMAGGRMTSLSSFMVYNPGGAVEGLRNGFVAVGSIRLLLHHRF